MKIPTVALTAIIAAPSMIDAWSIGGSPYSRMRPVVVWSPPRSRDACREQSIVNPGFRSSSPRYEITDTESKFEVAIDVPGVKPEDINISVEEDGQILSIAGMRESTSDGSYRFTSKFAQRFSLDATVDVDKFTANLNNGVLIVSVPKDLKRIEENIRSIPITVGPAPTEDDSNKPSESTDEVSPIDFNDKPGEEIEVNHEEDDQAA